MFDGDAFVAAMTPPRLKLDGEVVTGRLLSQLQLTEFEKEFAQYQTLQLTEDQAKDFLTRFITALGFDSVKVLSMPPAAVQAALLSFFVCHYRRGPTPGTEKAQTSGSSSPPAASEPQSSSSGTKAES